MSTNWSTPKTNIFAGINELRHALAYGCKARLIRLWNEDCQYPITEKHQDTDFRNYGFRIGYISSVNEIKNNPNMGEFEKHLSLNYVSCYGTPEAVKKYYKTGELSEDNFKGAGVNHLVQVDELIKFYGQFTESGGDIERANMYERQYRAPEHANDNRFFFDFYSYKHGSQYATKKFKHKLWVVELLDSEEEQPKLPVITRILMSIITALVYPLKYIPRKSVLHMPEYTNYSYRIGDVIHGFSVEFQIPKKFSFK
ncbi:MAG: hypothetical protein JXB49_14300 [Bacteroidales bacterium]|nr:hypothetical protein [Bacteroidales bacterium]